MKPFLDDNFLLQTKTAEVLYHGYTSHMPIIDYHSHLIPKQIADNKQFENITQPWLYGDHYKWRALRANGINEKYITGGASDWEKFIKWAETVPYTLRNPLYHWTHLELKGYFGISTLLDGKSAKSIYDKTGELLQTEDYRVQGLLRKRNVELVCTTDDPTDSLKHHKRIAEDGCEVKVLPTWRPDRVMDAKDVEAYNVYINKLSEVSDVDISSYYDLIKALGIRQKYFADHGCKLSDHGLEYFYSEEFTYSEINAIFDKLRSGVEISATELLKYKSALLLEFGVMNHSMGWTQQFHIGPLRNNNRRLLSNLGPDSGFDSMGDSSQAVSMSRYLDSLDVQDKLTKTIVYNLNPSDNEMMATMVGNFQDGSIAGKMQYGSAWWFLDQKDGMEKQLNTLSNLGLLSRFVGMLTDSRSFLSFPRHEYFRRILCNILGNDIENGLMPNDIELVGKMAQNICYNNAKKYFDFH